jgi:hypothetical protein
MRFHPYGWAEGPWELKTTRRALLPVLNSFAKNVFLAKLLRGENSNSCGLIRSVRDVLCRAGEGPYLPSRRKRETAVTFEWPVNRPPGTIRL